jgi:hypothetical protein
LLTTHRNKLHDAAGKLGNLTLILPWQAVDIAESAACAARSIGIFKLWETS